MLSDRREFLKLCGKSVLCATLPSSALAANLRTKPKVKLGIDVLRESGFALLSGSRVGLLTNPAGVDRYGRSTIDILRRSTRLTALYGPEHGIYGNEKADVPVADRIDPRTRLPVYSLYGKYRKPTREMLSKIDTLVIDLQDVGSRSYTYVSCMIRAMEACFECGKRVVVLDRPNPLGGLKVDGPSRDRQFKSYVGMLNVPYVHGLTIGELARFAKGESDQLDIARDIRLKGKLTVVPMRGWTRSMLWGDTGLRWIPPSPAIPSVSAAIGYAMLGLGAQVGGWKHGYGTQAPFRMLTFAGRRPEEIKAALDAYKIRGLRFTCANTKDAKGKVVRGVYVSVRDWFRLRPTEVSFYMMKLACKFNGGNVFKTMPASKESLFNKHTGSARWWREISQKGAAAEVAKFVSSWEKQAKSFQSHTLKYRLY